MADVTANEAMDTELTAFMGDDGKSAGGASPGKHGRDGQPIAQAITRGTNPAFPVEGKCWDTGVRGLSQAAHVAVSDGSSVYGRLRLVTAGQVALRAPRSWTVSMRKPPKVAHNSHQALQAEQQPVEPKCRQSQRTPKCNPTLRRARVTQKHITTACTRPRAPDSSPVATKTQNPARKIKPRSHPPRGVRTCVWTCADMRGTSIRLGTSFFTPDNVCDNVLN